MKKLKEKWHRRKGRSLGKIIVRHRGGGYKRKYRQLSREIREGSKIVWIGKDPNRTGQIALIREPGRYKRKYILASSSMSKGSRIKGRVELGSVNINSLVYDISGKYIRAGGTHGTVLRREGKYTVVKMPSSELKWIESTSKCMIGTVCLDSSELRQRAGRRRNLGWRPRVTGKAMNVCDHPLGGNTKGGKELKTIWGKLIKKVRNKKKNILV